MSGAVEGIMHRIGMFMASQDDAALMLPAVQFMANRDHLLAEAIAAELDRLTTPPARSYADAIEDAAKVADDLANAAARLQAALELHGVDAPIKNAQRETATTLAAAIRLLSQEPQP